MGFCVGMIETTSDPFVGDMVSVGIILGVGINTLVGELHPVRGILKTITSRIIFLKKYWGIT